jgi:hypothetical protein
MHTIFLAHALTGSQRRLVVLAVAVTAAAVMAGVSLAELRTPAGAAAADGATDAALAAAARSHHSQLAETAPSIAIDGIDAAEPLIKSAE